MLSRISFLCCITALLLFTTGACAQQSIQSPPWITTARSSTGLQAYRPSRRWRGLDLTQVFGGGNTMTGYSALASCTLCYANTADGQNALAYCTTCASNTALGLNALETLTSGSNNTAVGTDALYYDVTGVNSTALGYMALYSSQASNNTAVGMGTLQNGGPESFSTAVGYLAMNSSASPTGGNTAIGAYALRGQAGNGVPYNEGGNNVAVGIFAMTINTTGALNTGVGFSALGSNSIGGQNTAAGSNALYFNSSGNYNAANGSSALYDNTTGSDNTASGSQSLYNNTSGSGNTAVGAGALYSNTTGNYNIAVGFDANFSSGALTNTTALGNGATVNSSNQVVIGNSSVTSIGGFVTWSNFSDGRYKKNIQSNVPGLAFINKLNPITYTLDIDGIEAKLQKGLSSGKSGAASKSPQDDPIVKQAMQDKSAITYTGFVAQDVEKAADSVSFVFSGVDKPRNTDQSFYGLRYSDFVPPLVKAVQELSASSDKKDSTINALQTRFDSLQTQVSELRAMLMAQKASASAGTLDQNVPNPFTGSTTIGYSLPKAATSAQMCISDINGKVLAVIPLSGTGKNSITADVSGYAAGTYVYSLVVDGRVAGTKKMISVK